MTFKCKRCGDCCGIVPFSRAERKAAEKQAQGMGVDFVKNKMGERTVYFASKPEFKNGQFDPDKFRANFFTCPFLQRDEKGLCSCAIYDVRPQVCRKFGHGGHPLLQCPHDPNTDKQAIDTKINEVLNRLKGQSDD